MTIRIRGSIGRRWGMVVRIRRHVQRSTMGSEIRSGKRQSYFGRCLMADGRTIRWVKTIYSIIRRGIVVGQW